MDNFALVCAENVSFSKEGSLLKYNLIRMPRVVGKKYTNPVTVEFEASTGDLSSDDEFQVEDEYGSLAQTPVSYQDEMVIMQGILGPKM